MRRGLLLLALLPLLGACDEKPTSPDSTTSAATGTTTTVTASNVVFDGTLDVKGFSFYSFTVTSAGSATAKLASLSLVGHHDALAVPVRLGVGVPKGDGCETTQSIDVTPALTTQLTVSLAPGIYCLDIEDIGNLPGAAIFAIRFSHT